MDALLKAYAEKRRKDAEPAMEVHPATRRLVLAEVTKQQTPARAKPSPFQSLIALWPRLGLAFGLFLFLGALAWFLRHPNDQPDQLAKNTPPPPQAPEPQPLNRPMPENLANHREQDEKSSALAITAEPMPETRDKQKPQATPEAALALAPKDAELAAPPLPTRRGLEEDAAIPRADLQAPAPKPSAPTVASFAPPASKQSNVYSQNSVGYTLTNAVPLLAGRFVQARPSDEKDQIFKRSNSLGEAASRSTLNGAASKAKEFRSAAPNAQAASILTNFNVEQSGNRLRITDADGSVYEGPLWQEASALLSVTGSSDGVQTPRTLKAESNRGLEDLSKKELSADSVLVTNAPGMIMFQVSGTNFTSRQYVTFRGSFALAPAPPSTPASQPVLLRSVTATTTPAPVSAPAPTSTLAVDTAEAKQLQPSPASVRIQGKARLGEAVEWDIQAVPK